MSDEPFLPPQPPCKTCGGKGYIEQKVFTQEPAALLGKAAATRVTCPDCRALSQIPPGATD
jgi:hypothetical protein